MAEPTPPIHLHLIAYNEATRATIDAANRAPASTLADPAGSNGSNGPTGRPWRVLDNLANPRPDWYEYWPIRRFLREEALDEAAFYGFFSPKFSAKTGLDAAAVTRFVATHAANADVLLFSPQPDMGAFFLNVFEQGETFDAGFIEAWEHLLVHLGRPAPLRQMVMDARQVCFSNYFVARPAFWREWLAFNEALFAICEGPDSPLKALLTQRTNYGGGAPRKVFMMERTASLLLATQPRWRSVPHDPFGFGWSVSRFREFPQEAFVSDALKRAWRDTGWPEYLQAFAGIRERFVARPA